jgi:hypothetical protein
VDSSVETLDKKRQIGSGLIYTLKFDLQRKVRKGLTILHEKLVCSKRRLGVKLVNAGYRIGLNYSECRLAKQVK